MNASRTEGELLFEQYLSSEGILFEFEQVQNGKSKVPDYHITRQGVSYFFDVKDFARAQPGRGVMTFDPYAAIREKVNQGCRKFKEYKSYCCGLVLHNLGNPFVDLESTRIIMGAMYGNAAYSIPFNPEASEFDVDRMQPTFTVGGKMMNPKQTGVQNTTISALITLTRFYSDERVPRLIVWHNLVARIPFPRDLFNGRYDAHVALSPVSLGNVKPEVVFRGADLPVDTGF